MHSVPRRLLRALVLLAVLTLSLSFVPSASAHPLGDPQTLEVSGEGAEVRLRWRAAPDLAQVTTAEVTASPLTDLHDAHQALATGGPASAVSDAHRDQHPWTFTDAYSDVAARANGTAAIQPGIVRGALLAAAAGFLWHRRRAGHRTQVA